MSQFYKTHLPSQAGVFQIHQSNDFLDCYACQSDLSLIKAASLAMHVPAWTQSLLQLRNMLVAPLGLKNTQDFAEQPSEASPSLQFPITYQTETELQYGYDDRHLNFRITVLKEEGQIFLSTWVHTHNFFGNAYLTTIMPFHTAIMRAAIRRVAKGE